MRTFTPEMTAAIENYFAQRKNKTWGKQVKMGCLELIERHLTECSIDSFEACAGHFWFHWNDGVWTTHDEQDWREMKIQSPA